MEPTPTYQAGQVRAGLAGWLAAHNHAGTQRHNPCSLADLGAFHAGEERVHMLGDGVVEAHEAVLDELEDRGPRQRLGYRAPHEAVAHLHARSGSVVERRAVR